MKPYKTDVYIVDDHILLNEALTTAINQSEIVHVSRSFSTLEACAHALRKRRPDVILLDISMPDGNGIDFCRQMIAEYPQMRVVAMTCHDEPSVIQKALDAGIHGYVLKSASVEELLNAVRCVYRGERFVSPEVEAILERTAPHSVFLTPTERNVLELICEGFTNPQIAERINLSTETVNWHRKRLLAKFGVRNTVSLVTLVMREHIL